MLDTAQAQAYAAADFSKPHANLVRSFQRAFPSLPTTATVADLGCGPADIAIRIAHLYPGFSIDALDGSPAMLRCAQAAVASAQLSDRIRLLPVTLPDLTLPPEHYDIVVSNSLLHHLHAPETLWQTIRRIAKRGARVWVADLRRPHDEPTAQHIVKTHAADAPQVLQRDFYNSLLAAFTPQELRTQLARFDFEFEMDIPDDYHLSVTFTV